MFTGGDEMSPWEKLLERPHSRGHFVQLYETDEDALTKNVGHYLWQGLRQGDGVLVIATPEHQDLFSRLLERLGADLAALCESKQLVCWDAQETLTRFMVDGQPDWERFASVIREALRLVRPMKGAEGSRAYGEMVGILWKARQFAAAIRLEQFWNKLLEQSSFSLYCAYAIDVFGREFDVANLDGVLRTHTHLVPAQPNGMLEAALNRSMDETLGPKAKAMRNLIGANHRPAWAVMPTAEATVLWLRKNLPEQADQIVAQARQYYHSLLHPAGAAGVSD
jgi:hypothetical protein